MILNQKSSEASVLSSSICRGEAWSSSRHTLQSEVHPHHDSACVKQRRLALPGRGSVCLFPLDRAGRGANAGPGFSSKKLSR